MSVEGYSVGIDLGTSNSCVGIWQDGKVKIISNEYGSPTTPSYVTFMNGARYIGQSGKTYEDSSDGGTVFGTKRLIGRNFTDVAVQKEIKTWPFKVQKTGDRPQIVVPFKGSTMNFLPEQISAMVLQKMKDIAEAYLGGKVKNAVITVPAYFSDVQRNATKDAGRIAGLNVLRIINEPTAAAIAYGLESAEAAKVLIFDLGAGTFDVSVLAIEDGIFEVLSTAGDSHLGGKDFDDNLVRHFLEKFKSKYKKDAGANARALRRLRIACERAKRALSGSSTAYIEIESFYEGMEFTSPINRREFEEMNAALFHKTMELVKKALAVADVKRDEVDEIVLVGGSTHIPKIQLLLKELFNGKKLNTHLNPDEAVAYGATVQAALLDGTISGSAEEVMVMDILTKPIGIEAVGGTMSLLAKRPTLPTKVNTTIATSSDNEHALLLKVFEGDRALTKDCVLVGQFELLGIPPMPSGAKIDVTLDIDADGILSVSAKETSTGKVLTVRARPQFTADQIDRLQKDAEGLRKYDAKLAKPAASAAAAASSGSE